MAIIRLKETVSLRSRPNAQKYLDTLSPKLDDLESRCAGAREHIERLEEDLLKLKARIILAETMIGRIPVCDLVHQGKGALSFYWMPGSGELNSSEMRLDKIPEEPAKRFEAMLRYLTILQKRKERIEEVLQKAEKIVFRTISDMRTVKSDINLLSKRIAQTKVEVFLTKKEVLGATAIGFGVVADFIYQTVTAIDNIAITGAKIYGGLLAGAVVFYFMLKEAAKQRVEKIETMRSAAEASLSMLDFNATAKKILEPLGELRKEMEETLATCLQGVEELITATESFYN